LAIAPGPLKSGGAFRLVGRIFVYEYAPGAESRFSLPVKPLRARRIDDTVVFALGEHGLWVGRLGRPPGTPGRVEPGLQIVHRHRFAEPVVDFTIEDGRVTPLTGPDRRPALTLDPGAPSPLPDRETSRLLNVSWGDDRIVNPRWVVETTLLAGTQMHPEEGGFFEFTTPVSIRLGFSPWPGHTVGFSAFIEGGEVSLFRRPCDGDERWCGISSYHNPLFSFYRYSPRSFPVSFQVEPIKAVYHFGDPEYGARLVAQWARQRQGLRVGVELHADFTEHVARFGLWLVIGWNGPPRGTP
jgi:hypothetical protein